jgi:hypothetical protein
MAQELVKLASALDAKIDGEIVKIETQLDEAVATGVTVTGTGDNKFVTTAKLNLKTGTATSADAAIPLASKTEAGLMASGDVTALQKNTEDIAALKGSTKVWYIDITGAVDPDDPTQQELQDAFEAKSGTTGKANDGTTIKDEVSGFKWIWSETDDEWKLDSTPPIGNFTEGNPGLIVGAGSTEDGKVYAENDGKGSIVGWGTLKGKVTTLESTVSGLETDLGALEARVDDLESDAGDLESEIAALKVQVFDKNTPLLGAAADYSALIAKLTLEG